MDTSHELIPVSILHAYGLNPTTIERSMDGLINQTWFVENYSNTRFVLQRLHPAIGPQVNRKIDRITQHLTSLNLCTPMLITATSGQDCVTCDGFVWRLLGYVAGNSFNNVPDLQHAREAGSVLASFHGAFLDYPDVSEFERSQIHNLKTHLANLDQALSDYASHDRFVEIQTLADEIMHRAERLPCVTESAPCIVHGDPKISNILFDPSGRGLCMVDLDTVGLMPIVWELGDAFRSWCNPHDEDAPESEFSLDMFKAGLEGYASGRTVPLDHEDAAAIVGATRTIYTELAARFCADALRESYFAWNPARFDSRTEHNLARARNQLNASSDLAKKNDEAEEIVQRIFAHRA
ncbi:MAG: aminoglycoside phosphotransferase family protein [Proteobacteria bacterium]|nr:aminoglycoside phosphotransferase family protein [Pseudomonadota bacterium]